MKVIEPGHIYQLQHLDGSGTSLLTFVNREVGTEHEGTQTQEVLRACIDKAKVDAHEMTEVMTALINRTQHCDSCLRWEGNDKIVAHLAGAMQAYAAALKSMRMALALHESRAIERKTEKGIIEPEMVPTAGDGHFVLGREQDVFILQDKIRAGYARAGARDTSVVPYRCTVPMCGESGVCDECRRRGAG